MTREHDDQAFSDALEAALDGRNTPPEPLSDEDRASIALASELARADFSAAYGDRAALRQRLLGWHGETRVGWWSPTGDRIVMFTHNRRLVTAAVTLMVVGGLAFARFSPALAGSRQEIVTWMSTEGNLPEGLPDVIVPLFGGVPAPIGTGVIVSPDGVKTQISFKSVNTVEEAQAAAAFNLKQPTALPDGFALKSGSVSDDGSRVYLGYENGSGGALSLSQSSVAPPEGGPAVPPDPCIGMNNPGEPRETIRNGTGEPPNPGPDVQNGAGVPGQPGDLVLNGTPDPNRSGQTVHSGDNQLPCMDIQVSSVHWEADGIYYVLIGTLGKAELQVVADSVK